VTVSGISRNAVTSAAQIMALLEEGNARRKVDSTDANAASSRSHAVGLPRGGRGGGGGGAAILPPWEALKGSPAAAEGPVQLAGDSFIGGVGEGRGGCGVVLAADGSQLRL
jgi:hypothetical protein